eukprot:scaffold420037_cov19-Prasinocladus_malaysianus.AAC.1
MNETVWAAMSPLPVVLVTVIARKSSSIRPRELRLALSTAFRRHSLQRREIGANDAPALRKQRCWCYYCYVGVRA